MTSTEEIWPDDVSHFTELYPPAVKAGNWVFLSGQLAKDAEGNIAEDARVDPNFPYYSNAQTMQSGNVLDKIVDIMEEAGGSIDDILRIYQWWEVAEEDRDWLDAEGWTRLSITRYLERLYGEYIHEKSPGSTGMGVHGLLGKDTVIMVDGILRLGDEEKNAVISVPDIPQPEADYSEVVEKGGFLFTAGEVPTDFIGDWGVNEHKPDRSPDPRTAEYGAVAREARTNPYMWYGEPIRNHTDYTLGKLESIVEQADTPIENTVKAEIYLPNPEDFVGFEETWREWFPDDPPARVIAPHQGLGLKGARVEIALQLVKPRAGIDVETIETDAAPKPVVHEPQAVRAGDLLFLSSQMAHDENGVSSPPPSPKAQMNEILENAAAICDAAGTSLENVGRCQCFHTDLSNHAEAMEALTAHFEEGNRPAVTPIEVGEPLLVPGCDMVLDIIAHVP